MSLIVNSILNMKADIYVQSDIQDPNTGAIKREWAYSRTIPCHAKGIISNSATSRGGDKQVLNTRYMNEQSIEIRSEQQITYREKVTNIRDSRDNIIWKELDYPNETPTVFEISGMTPINDPFGTTLGFNMIAKRSENQQIGL